MIVPSIDLMAGRAVQLRRGAEKVLEAPEDPLVLARRFAFHGEIAVVDLDAALGRGDNRELVRRLCGEVPCRAGGGVREERDVVALIKAGARRVMIGTAAAPEFLKRFPRDWIQVALDAREGRTVDQGWRRDTGESYLDRARRLEPFCSGFLFTQVEVEGTLEGVPLEPVRALRAATSLPLTVAGGVAGPEDVRALEDLGADVQVGMALYTGRIDLDAAFLARPDFGRGPLPTVVQEEDGRVLMLAWSTAASLGEALRQRRGIYWSRSRQSLWRKGDTSGHVQALTRARYDCDADALLFTVRQEGPACHAGRDACFGDAPRFDLAALRRVLAARRGADPARSWTARLLGDRDLVRAKIREEAGEVCDAPDRGNLVWELADLLYHAAALMEAEGIRLEEIEAELRGRHR
jgi:phosphoribosyl-ATP pyrophosphohydrolase